MDTGRKRERNEMDTGQRRERNDLDRQLFSSLLLEMIFFLESGLQLLATKSGSCC